MTKLPNSASGFTLVEMLMILAVIGVMSAVAVGVAPSMIHNAKSDSALTAVVDAVETARNRAVGERREFQVIFTAPNRIQVLRIEVPGPGTTTVSNTYLDNGQTYLKFTGTGAPGDTPDRFGAASAIDFGTTPTIRFTSDGSLLDSSGDPVNGTVFFGDPARVSSARALTIFGATGLVHAWKYDGTQWVQFQ
jgi:Tfp pilus assembly protein FimT